VYAVASVHTIQWSKLQGFTAAESTYMQLASGVLCPEHSGSTVYVYSTLPTTAQPTVRLKHQQTVKKSLTEWAGSGVVILRFPVLDLAGKY
jgi:hypothetical protein